MLVTASAGADFAGRAAAEDEPCVLYPIPEAELFQPTSPEHRHVLSRKVDALTLNRSFTRARAWPAADIPTDPTSRRFAAAGVTPRFEASRKVSRHAGGLVRQAAKIHHAEASRFGEYAEGPTRRSWPWLHSHFSASDCMPLPDLIRDEAELDEVLTRPAWGRSTRARGRRPALAAGGKMGPTCGASYPRRGGGRYAGGLAVSRLAIVSRRWPRRCGVRHACADLRPAASPGCRMATLTYFCQPEIGTTQDSRTGGEHAGASEHRGTLWPRLVALSPATYPLTPVAGAPVRPIRSRHWANPNRECGSGSRDALSSRARRSRSSGSTMPWSCYGAHRYRPQGLGGRRDR